MKKILFFAALLFSSQTMAACPAFLDYDLPELHSDDTVNICEMAAGQPMLVVNTASHCGFTRQFEGLEALHDKYHEQGLFVVGFASNDFNQEAKTEAEAAEVCRENYGVSFTMVAPSFVTGQRANPVFQEINQQSNAPDWNFNKYLLNQQGEVVAHFNSKTEPEDPALVRAIESELAR